MFGFFRKKKKEEPHYDPVSIKIEDLRKGWFFDYKYKTWEAKEEYEYDWGNSNFSYEFMIISQDNEKLFLSVEQDDGLNLTVTEKLRFSKLDQADEIADAITTLGRPPRQVEINGILFYRESENPGYFRNIDKEDSEEFIVWEYWDDSEEHVLNIEQWGDESFEVSIGIAVPEHAFTNILPVEKNA
ncbi:MAG: DUF4178 domain-containing protein [Saprospiraceae bacterium]|nr:DUF4178 domain-containing protein [Saprospiraceae bacterium]